MKKIAGTETRVLSFRLSDDEFAEVEAYLQRAGVRRSEFIRQALLSQVRGATVFAELLPSIAASLERQMADLTKTVVDRTEQIRTLAAASVFSSANLLDDGKMDDSKAARLVEGAISRAISASDHVISFVPSREGEDESAGAKR